MNYYEIARTMRAHDASLKREFNALSETVVVAINPAEPVLAFVRAHSEAARKPAGKLEWIDHARQVGLLPRGHPHALCDENGQTITSQFDVKNRRNLAGKRIVKIPGKPKVTPIKWKGW